MNHLNAVMDQIVNPIMNWFERHIIVRIVFIFFIVMIVTRVFCFDSSTYWSALAAIFTGIAASAIILAKEQLLFEAWLKAQDLFTEEKFVNARGVVLYSLKGRPYNSWSTDETEKAMLVCRKMDELAHLIPYLGKKKVLNVWGNPIARTWSILENFIKYERSPSKANWQQKWFAFENIAKEAIAMVK